MEQNKGFWYADWSFPIFVGLLSSGVFAGTHMYYLYGIGAFNEVAFVAMLKSGIDTGVYGAVAASAVWVVATGPLQREEVSAVTSTETKVNFPISSNQCSDIGEEEDKVLRDSADRTLMPNFIFPFVMLLKRISRY